MPDTSDKQVLDPQYFLRKQYVLERFIKKMEPALMFDENFFPKIKTNAKAYTWFEDENSALGDSERKDPIEQTSLTHFPRVKVSSLVQNYGFIKRYGFSIAFDEDVVMFPEYIDQVGRAIDRVGVYMASKINDVIALELNGVAWNGTAPTDDATNGPRVVTASATWDNSSGTPIADVNKIRRLIMDQNTIGGYDMTDIWIDPKTQEALSNYMMGDNAKAAAWIKDPRDPNAWEVPQLMGRTFHMMKTAGTNQLRFDHSGTKHSAALCLDRANPAVTMYYATNPRYEGAFVQAHNWLDDETGELVYKFQVQFGVKKHDKLAVGLITKLVT